MKKNSIIVASLVLLSAYFTLTLYVFPTDYLSRPLEEPRPTLDVTVSDTEILLGQDFAIKTVTKNHNQQADVLITSIAFPSLDKFGNNVRLVSYDFIQSPRYIEVGNPIGSEYTSGEQISAQYPAIEAYSRNVKPGEMFQMSVSITPQDSGPFKIRIKTIAIPHASSLSHYPHDGILDYQKEYVMEYSVLVKS